MACEYQSRGLNNIMCSTEATTGFVSNICAILLLLDTDIFVSNLFLYPESLAYLCIPFDVLLPTDPSQKSPFLQHSMLSRSESTLQTLECSSQSVPPKIVRHLWRMFCAGFRHSAGFHARVLLDGAAC